MLRRVATKKQPAETTEKAVTDHTRHMDIVMKVWRLTRSYIANPGAFTLEKPAQYVNKETTF